MEFIAQAELVPRIFFDFGDCSAAAAARWAADRCHPIRVGIFRLRFGAEQTSQPLEQPLQIRGRFSSLLHTLILTKNRELRTENCLQANSESTNSFASNGSRSPAFSPTPTNRTGSPSSREIATTTPPLAVPSSLVRTIPVTPADCVNLRACCNPFWPVVASMTSRVS